MDIVLNYHFLCMRKWRLVNMPLEKQTATNELAFVADCRRQVYYIMHFTEKGTVILLNYTSALAAH